MLYPIKSSGIPSSGPGKFFGGSNGYAGRGPGQAFLPFVTEQALQKVQRVLDAAPAMLSVSACRK